MTLLNNRTALVTGGGQGNGASIAKGLAAQGARVVVSDINPHSAEATAKQITEQGGTALAVALDVTDARAVKSLFEDLGKIGWYIDLLVNNAGICPRVPYDSADFDAAWTKTMDINVNGVMNVSLACVLHLRRAGGTIVNIASIAAFISVPSTLAYMASKSGVKGLTQALAVELAPQNIRVNAIAPGQIATPMLEASLRNPERMREIEARITLGRIGTPDELVGPTVFLSSALSSFVTGITLPVDGGFTAT